MTPEGGFLTAISRDYDFCHVFEPTLLMITIICYPNTDHTNRPGNVVSSGNQKKLFMTRYISGEEAVKAIKSGDRVFVHGGAATPHFLLQKMVERANELSDVELVSISMQGEAPFVDRKYKGIFRVNSLFVSPNIREAVNEGRGDYVPIFLSEIPVLFRRGILPLDVAMVQVSPPDNHG